MADMHDGALAAAVPAATPVVATPAEELSLLVGWGAAVFYWAEAGANPMVRSYWDALHYISTALSVGYANIFPVTALGKAIGSVVMTIGPALSARALDASPRAATEADGGTALLGEKLDAILAELRRANGRTD
ncbi:MAG TPA: potassium channel family protein [Polyangia bacterium]|nr:potassium channel family protein [Polyangia bacterium]